MRDQFNRNIEYARISITDRCNLRCRYCMPAEGIEQVSHADILRYDEILRIAGIFGELGISSIKITGGEPLVRKGVPALIQQLKSLDGIEEATLTTNGVLLRDQIEDLHAAGVDAINISLDTLDPEYYRELTRIGNLEDVLGAIDLCEKYPDIRFKINCVPLESDERNSWLRVAELAADKPIDIRFIELMPIGLGRTMKGVSEDKLRESLDIRFGTHEKLAGKFGNGPSVYYQYPGLKGRIGFISALSHKFCDSCNRVRLTSEGQLKQCLHFEGGLDVRELIRGGAGDEELREAIRNALYYKPKGHLFTEEQSGDIEKRKMSEIGG